MLKNLTTFTMNFLLLFGNIITDVITKVTIRLKNTPANINTELNNFSPKFLYENIIENIASISVTKLLIIISSIITEDDNPGAKP